MVPPWVNIPFRQALWQINWLTHVARARTSLEKVIAFTTARRQFRISHLLEQCKDGGGSRSLLAVTESWTAKEVGYLHIGRGGRWIIITRTWEYFGAKNGRKTFFHLEFLITFIGYANCIRIRELIILGLVTLPMHIAPNDARRNITNYRPTTVCIVLSKMHANL